MNRKTAVIAMLLGSTISCAGAATDDEIKHGINYAYRIFDNPSFQDAVFNEAMRSCGYDTNRFERLLSEIACDSLTNAHHRYARYAISDIGSLGTTNSLPFLYSCATNAAVGGRAMISAVKIGGLSSNVVDGLNQYLSLPDAKMADRAMSCYYLLETPGVTNAPIAEKTYLAECLTGFAPRTPFCVEDIDAGIIALDPTYRYSRRRLAVARAQSALDLNEYGTNYVNGVIGELVAYPESALGD